MGTAKSSTRRGAETRCSDPVHRVATSGAGPGSLWSTPEYGLGKARVPSSHTFRSIPWCCPSRRGGLHWRSAEQVSQQVYGSAMAATPSPPWRAVHASPENRHSRPPKPARTATTAAPQMRCCAWCGRQRRTSYGVRIAFGRCYAGAEANPLILVKQDSGHGYRISISQGAPAARGCLCAAAPKHQALVR